MKERRGFIGLVSLITFFCLITVAGATDFSGTYIYKTAKAIVTLTLSQDQQGKLSGLLSSTTGAKFQVIGHSDELVTNMRDSPSQLTDFF